MYDDGTHGDNIAGDKIFTVALPYQNGAEEVKYYFRAENEEAIKLEPQRAEYEFYIYSADIGITTHVVPVKELTVYPNPVRNITTLRYYLNRERDVSIRIFNYLGQEVAVLLDGNAG